jgi:hypothetical protein
MTTETFKASVQYGDWTGTAAADRADQNDPERWLEKQGKKKPGEFLVGIEIWAGENHGKHKDPVSVNFLLAALPDHDTVQGQIRSGKPLQVRKVQEDMNLVDFFGLFKRFSVAISNHGMLTDREYEY